MLYIVCIALAGYGQKNFMQKCAVNILFCVRDRVGQTLAKNNLTDIQKLFVIAR